MKSRAIAFALVLATLGCTHAAPPPAPGPAPGERFTLRVEGSARIRGEPVAVVFEGVRSDNRCAVDVVCITAGEARVALRLDRPGALSVTFELDTDRNTSAVVNGYRISLLGVSPAPRSTVQINPRDYVVELTVARETP